ncbi:MAG: mannitol-1-phosphate 5-dehydrogenase [Chloroflexota bacterium]|nr:mannitol-1-phosphate 5-dehydrogenase [Chloroflexota bacterium]
MQKAAIFGAGNVGRGFLGQLFSESGYEVVFVDIDEPLIMRMKSQGSYTIRLVDNQRTEEVQVGPVTGLLSAETERVVELLTEASLGATAVGARALPQIAPLVAQGIAARMQRGIDAPLNIIVCENLKGASSIFRDMVAEHLDASAQSYMADHVGFVSPVIARMVPELPAELRAQDPTLIITEPYKELPVDRSEFVGDIPEIVGMQPRDDFAFYTSRKLYLHNMTHAILGYLGYRRGYELGYEALEDAEVRPILDGALDESVQGLAARYGAPACQLQEHVSDLVARCANRALADPVLRLARDPLRKLAPSDRLVGAARMAEAAGIEPFNLAWGIAGALAYDAPSDGIAVELQERIAQEGVEAVLESVCEIDPQEPLGRAVLERHSRLAEEARWS